MTNIVPGRRYTFAELEKFRNNPDFANWAARGYVWRQELDGALRLVHWSKAHMDNEVRDPKFYVDKRDFSDIFPTEPIQRRTPQERKQSLINRWWEACKQAGTIPGLSEEQITALIGREWKEGVSSITYEDVERLAASMLQEAENKQEAAEAKKVARTSPTD